jgi:hypothetical protein
MSSVDRIGGLQQVQAGPPAVFRRNDITYRQCCEYDEDMSGSQCVQSEQEQDDIYSLKL